MNKKNYSLIFYFLLLTLQSANYIPVHAKTILMTQGDSWCPYVCDKKITGQNGYIVDLAQEIFSKKDIVFKFELVPWARVLKNGAAGKIDAIVGSFKEGKPKFIWPENDFAKSQNKFAVLKVAPWKFTGPESLNKIVLGLTLDYVYGGQVDILKKHSKSYKESGGETPLQENILKLLKHEVDAIIDEENVLDYTIKELALKEKIIDAGKFGPVVGVYIGFPKVLPHSEEYAKILSQGIQEAKQTGRYNEIRAKYGLN